MLTSTVAEFAPPITVMVNALSTNPVATNPSGNGEGIRMRGRGSPAIRVGGIVPRCQRDAAGGYRSHRTAEIHAAIGGGDEIGVAFEPLVNSVG